jgi:hypothetical protein
MKIFFFWHFFLLSFFLFCPFSLFLKWMKRKLPENMTIQRKTSIFSEFAIILFFFSYFMCPLFFPFLYLWKKQSINWSDSAFIVCVLHNFTFEKKEQKKWKEKWLAWTGRTSFCLFEGYAGIKKEWEKCVIIEFINQNNLFAHFISLQHNTKNNNNNNINTTI